MPDSNEDDKKTPFGKSEAEDKGGKTPLDKPSNAADDFATDERRKKAIRGREDFNDK